MAPDDSMALGDGPSATVAAAAAAQSAITPEDFGHGRPPPLPPSPPAPGKPKPSYHVSREPRRHPTHFISSSHASHSDGPIFLFFAFSKDD